MDYKSVDKAYRWPQADDERTFWSQRVDWAKRHFEWAKDKQQADLREVELPKYEFGRQLIINMNNSMLKVYRQELKLTIYGCNGDLRNSIKSFEKFKELERELLELAEESVEQGVCQENWYLQICEDAKENVGVHSARLEDEMEYYKRRC